MVFPWLVGKWLLEGISVAKGNCLQRDIQPKIKNFLVFALIANSLSQVLSACMEDPAFSAITCQLLNHLPAGNETWKMQIKVTPAICSNLCLPQGWNIGPCVTKAQRHDIWPVCQASFGSCLQSLCWVKKLLAVASSNLSFSHIRVTVVNICLDFCKAR